MKNDTLYLKNWRWGTAAIVVLWLMAWGGYNANFWRLGALDFPSGVQDAFQATRTFLPLLAGLLATVFLFVRRKSLPEGFLFTPLGLFSLYALSGIAASVLSLEPGWALYWALMYGSIVVILWSFLAVKDPLKNISFIIRTNWVIAAFLSIFLLGYFLIQPGVTSSLTYNFLICSKRIYEGFAGIEAEFNLFGMVGTRPTGLGRYAGIAAVMFFVAWLYYKGGIVKKWAWFFCFLPFFIILFFAKGKTEIVAFIVSLAFILFIYKKLKTYHVSWILLSILLSFLVIFYNIPCKNPNFFNYRESEKIPIVVTSPLPSNDKIVDRVTIEPTIIPALLPIPLSTDPELSELKPKSQENVTKRKITTVANLSGRINGVWRDSWHLFLRSPVFGFGFQADRFFLEGQHAHNTIIHALVQAGILGTAALTAALVWVVIMIYNLFRYVSLVKREKIFLIQITAVLIFILIRGTTESFAFYGADWLFLAPIIVYIQTLYFNKKSELRI